MKRSKKLVALATLLAMFGTSMGANAQEYRTDAGGYGYQESRTSPGLAPAIALGTIAVVAIVAVAVQNRGHGHGHGHSH